MSADKPVTTRTPGLDSPAPGVDGTYTRFGRCNCRNCAIGRRPCRVGPRPKN